MARSSVHLLHLFLCCFCHGALDFVYASGTEQPIAFSFLAGLVGNNFLNLLEMAKKNVLQPGAAVVPCAASLYVMGIHVPPSHMGKYDLSSLDKYRSEVAPPKPPTQTPLGLRPSSLQLRCLVRPVRDAQERLLC